MNINEEMRRLRDMGAGDYKPEHGTVETLVKRARRRRAARQVGTAVVSGASALLLAVVGVQVAQVVQDLDAGRNDRNVIEKSFDDLFDSKYDSDNGSYQGEVDLDEIFKKLNKAANTETEKPDKKNSDTSDKKKSGSATTTEPCKDDTTSYEYKWYDCSQDKWRYYEGWYQDKYGDGAWLYCPTDGGVEHPDLGVFYNCDKGTWKTLPGYFEFIDGEIYKCAKWFNTATEVWFWGNYSPSYDKVAFCESSTSTSWFKYEHLNGLANWIDKGDGTFKCAGSTGTFEYGAPWVYDCNTEQKYMWDTANYKWFSLVTELKGYHHRSEVITSGDRTFEWNGAEWVETTPA